MMMTGSGERAEEAALWQRWRALSPTLAADEASGEAGGLAAYIDGRLDEAGAEAVEAGLFAHPERLDDVIAARLLARGRFPTVAASMLAKAMALVAPREAEIVPFPVRRAGWRAAVAWGGLAASLLITSLIGFTLGSNAYLNLMRQPAASESPFHELLDPPGGLFTTGGEEET
jgi:anti-sigma factor RsiW